MSDVICTTWVRLGCTRLCTKVYTKLCVRRLCAKLCGGSARSPAEALHKALHKALHEALHCWNYKVIRSQRRCLEGLFDDRDDADDEY